MDEQNRQQQPNIPSSGGTSVDCDEALALVPAYSIGATDDAETRLVEAALTYCPEVATELREYQQMVGGLLHSAPVSAPPPALREKMLQAAINPLTQPAVAVSKPTLAPRRRIAPSWVAAAAAVALFIGSSIYWSGQVSDLEDQRDLLMALSSNTANQIALVSTGASTPSATLSFSDQSQYVVLSAQDLPALTDEFTYQLWLLRGDERVSAGIFRVNNSGTGSLLFRPREDLGAFEAVGITVEPAGGSAQPTTTPVALATI
jgi:anti-sigma-K factor RskA